MPYESSDNRNAIIAYFLVVAVFASIVAAGILAWYSNIDGIIDPKEITQCKLAEELDNRLTLTPAEDKKLVRANVICGAKVYQDSYRYRTSVYEYLYYTSVVLVAVLGLVTSILVASGATAHGAVKPLAASLPLVATTITALSAQFHFGEYAQIREQGRLAAARLVLEGAYLSLNDSEFDKKVFAIRKQILDLEENQANQYFQRLLGDGQKKEGVQQLNQQTNPAPPPADKPNAN